MLNGIDVSRYQGKIDWGTVAAGARFAAIRATIGNSYTDPNFEQNVSEANYAGVLFTTYHVIRNDSSASEQFRHITSTLGERLNTMPLPIVLDVEVPGDNAGRVFTIRNAAAIADAIYNTIGYWPIIYTAEWFIAPVRGLVEEELERLKRCPLWVASYTEKPVVPKPWDVWAFWQYTDRGRVPGISASVDMDRFNGTLVDMLSLAKKSSVRPQVDITVTGRGGVSVNYIYKEG